MAASFNYEAAIFSLVFDPCSLFFFHIPYLTSQYYYCTSKLQPLISLLSNLPKTSKLPSA